MAAKARKSSGKKKPAKRKTAAAKKAAKATKGGGWIGFGVRKSVRKSAWPPGPRPIKTKD